MNFPTLRATPLRPIHMLALLLCLIFNKKAAGQSAYENYQRCLQSIAAQESQASNAITDKWYEENPDPKRYVTIACEDHGPKFQCRRHRKQCIGFCDCYRLYQQEQNALSSRYQGMKDACERTYQRAQDDERHREERRRKEEERVAREEKARQEKAKKEQEAREKAEKEEAAKSKSSGKSSSGPSGKKGSEKESTTGTNTTTYYDAEAEARRQRIEATQKADRQENITYAAGTAAAIGAMSFMKDEYINDETYLKFFLGFAYESQPVITNDYRYGKSKIENAAYPGFSLGLTSRLNLSKSGGVALQLQPFVQLNLAAFSPGTNGGSSTYGGNATLYLSNNSDAKLHFFGEGSYQKRSGTYNYDLDAAAGGFGTTNAVSSSEWNYSILRYGGGFKLQFLGGDVDDQETYFRPGIFFERPSFAPNSQVMIGNLQIMISSFLTIDIDYSRNYLVPGTIKFKNTFERSENNYFNIKLTHNGLLAPSY